MKQKGLVLMLALAVGGMAVAHAQDTSSMSTGDTATSTSQKPLDDRWYIAPTIGGFYNNTDRNTNSRQLYYGLGFGKYIRPNISIDIFADRTSRNRDAGGKWTSNALGVAGRLYGGEWLTWRPYALLGLMGSFHNTSVDKGWSPAAELGVGVADPSGFVLRTIDA